MNNGFAMEIIFIIQFAFAVAFITYAVYSTRRFKKLAEEIDNLNLEQSKLNFLFFVSEKKKKLNQDSDRKIDQQAI